MALAPLSRVARCSALPLQRRCSAAAPPRPEFRSHGLRGSIRRRHVGGMPRLAGGLPLRRVAAQQLGAGRLPRGQRLLALGICETNHFASTA